ncbi:MAG: hypothetical protein RLO51_07995 [Thalassobaculum sp.]|uniref:hypothetical protein n=1 Tax=Thalassobaculum sp. TaxID=2022740 RepID=UPI0032EE4F49
MTILITLVAGFGVLFMSMKLLTAGAREMVSHRFRRVLRRLTRSYPYAALFGLITGPLTLKTSVLFYTVAGMVAARALSLKRGADVIVWSNIGGSPIIFLLAIDASLLDEALLGAAGVMYLLDLHRRERTRHFVQALLGAGLLILGIDLMREAAFLMKGTALLDAALLVAAHHPLVALAIGLSIGFVMPVLVIAIVTVSLVASGSMEFLIAGFLLVGGMFGNLSKTSLYMRRFDRATQSLAYFNVANQSAAALLVTGLLVLEWSGMSAPVSLLTAWLPPDSLASRGVMIIVLWEAGTILIALAFRDRSLGLAVRLVRVSKVDRLASPRYLPAEPYADSETAPLLAEKEMSRLLPNLGVMIEAIGTDPTRTPAHTPAVLHDANLALASRIEIFIQEVQDQSQSRSFLIGGTLLGHRVQLAKDLTETVTAFVATAKAAAPFPGLAPSVAAMAESLHFLVGAVAETLIAPDAEDIETISRLTSDRAETIQRMRERLVNDMPALDRDAHQALFALSSLYERSVWLLHRLLPREPSTPVEPSAVGTAAPAP